MLNSKLLAATAAAEEVIGQHVFIGGTGSSQTEYTWVVPDGVTSICAVAIGSGGAGDVSDTSAEGHRGGDLRWINNVAVTPGETLQVRPGSGPITDNASGNYSALYRTTVDDILTAAGGSGRSGVNGTSTTIGGNVGGGNGNLGGGPTSTSAGGGGGAGGYSGEGGSGENGASGYDDPPEAGSGAAYGGERGTGRAYRGGGVNLIGIGSTGSPDWPWGIGGSWGIGGYSGNPSSAGASNGGFYGGGGGGNDSTTGNPAGGGAGAIRIIYGGERSFPSAAGNYLPMSPNSFTEIEIQVQLPRISTQTYETQLSFIDVYDENGTNYFAPLTAVSGAITDFSSLSANEFSCSSTISGATLGVLKNSDDFSSGVNLGAYPITGMTDKYAISFFIKLASAKKISKINFGSGSVPSAFFPYIRVLGDGEDITYGDAVMVPTFNYQSVGTRALWTVEFT